MTALVASSGCSVAPATDTRPAAPTAAPPTAAPPTAAPSTAAPAAPGRTSDPVVRETYGFYAPYGQTTSTVVPAPPGFVPLSLQDVGRHGSRATVSGRPVKRVRALCRAAASDGELTALGAALCADVRTLGAAMDRLGYGELSPLGRQEWRQIGERTAQDHRAFFVAAAEAKASIRFSSSSPTRAKDSSAAFRAGIEAATPELELELEARTTQDRLLRFATPLTDEARTQVDRVEQARRTRAAASDVLQRLFGRGRGTFADARAVWQLYAIAPGMGMDLDAYLTPADAEALATLDDAETFYRYGPGLRGNAAFASAAPLRADLLRVVQQRLDGGTTMATFRHAHAETVAPLAALLRLGPSSRSVPADAASSANGWRGSEDVKMASSIDVAVYAKGDEVLVTVRHNERPTTVLDCPSSDYGPYFYDFATLRRCWS